MNEDKWVTDFRERHKSFKEQLNISDSSYWRWVFAGMAMQGIITNSISLNYGDTAMSAAYYADALIKELEKPKK